MITIHRPIGGCMAGVELQGTVVRWEEEVHGLCRIWSEWGGRLRRVEVNIQLTPTRDQSYLLLGPECVRTWEALEVAAGTPVDLPFALRVPPRAGLTDTATVMLTVFGRRFWQRTWCCAPFTLVPARCYTDVLEVAAAVTGFTPGAWQTAVQGDGVRIDLHPAAESNSVECLTLELLHANGFVYGQLIIDPVRPETGAIRALAGIDRISHKIRFAQGDRRAATSQIAELLRPHLDGVRHLPIPASAPGLSTESLPLAAGAVALDDASMPRISDERPEV